MSTSSWCKFPSAASGFLGALVLSLPARAALDLPDYPLFLSSTGVTPNILLTLDDSGSMRRAFVPEHCGDASDCGKLDNRWAKSVHANAIYYDPSAQYDPPKRADGSTYSTSFSEAWRNGFYTYGTAGGVNFGTRVTLSSGYRPTAKLDMSDSPPEEFSNREHVDSGTTRTSDPAASFTITDYQNADISGGTNNPGTNLLAVVVTNGSTKTILRRSGPTNSSCGTRPPSEAQYTTYISGSSLLLCFRDVASMRGKPILLVHQRSDAGPAYYNKFNKDYTFEGNSPVIRCADPQSKFENACYDYVAVGDLNGEYDMDGDGDKDKDDARLHFAYWYSFYRTRSLAVSSGASLAFADLDGTARVAWQALNTCDQLPTTSCEGWTGSYGSNAIGYFSGAKRNNFYNWLARSATTGGTPLVAAMKRAGEYFQTADPYANDFATPNSGEHTCRRNHHILMTDGIRTDSGSRGNVDGSNATLPLDETQSPSVAKTYTASADASRPYRDSYQNTLADEAFYFWKTDLRNNLRNIIIPSIAAVVPDKNAQYWEPRNDPATWQHMTTHTLGLGLGDFIAASGLTWTGDMYSGSYLKIKEGSLQWPQATAQSGSDPNYGTSAFDLWHAAINSRGRFFSAESPSDLRAAFKAILDSIGRVDAFGGGAALSTNTTVTSSHTAVYKASFARDGSGNLLALPYANGGLGDDASAYWDAATGIPRERSLFTTNTTNIGNGNGEEFAGCNGDLETALNSNTDGVVDDLCARRLNFLRSSWLPDSGSITGATWADGTVTFTLPEHGFTVDDKVVVSGVLPLGFDGTYTLTATTADTFSGLKVRKETDPPETNPGIYSGGGSVAYFDFRNRTSSVFGGVTHSGPAYVRDEDYGYGRSGVVLDGHDIYRSYVEDTKKDRIPMLYVGADDGMLHGFYAPDCASKAACATAEAGKEMFAYVPRGVYPHLSKLTDPRYRYTYYVGGSPSIGDAYIDDRWRTYLLGSLRGGGKSIFALDISSPETMSASDVKWEFTDDHLWQTYSQPQIGADQTDRWVAVFGSGYKDEDDPSTTSDEAYLYVVNLATGQPVQPPILAPAGASNGLGTPVLYDYEPNNGVVDVAYAGDLKGNLWKFVNSNGTWSVGNNGHPLFIATDGTSPQPITAQPRVGTFPGQDGVLVYFGTGKYLEFDDLATGQAQSFYAVWDDGTDHASWDRSDLFPYQVDPEQTLTWINPQTRLPETSQVRTTSAKVSGTSLDWGSQKGWYLDLPAPAAGEPSERVISPAMLLSFTSAPSRVLFVSNVLNSDPCARGGTTWLMELDLITGAPTGESVFDFNNDRKFDDEDLLPGGVTASGVALPDAYGLTGTPLLLVNPEEGTLTKAFTGSTGVSGTPTATQSADKASSGSATRIYWQQIQ